MKKVVALFLSLLMALMLMPTVAFADNAITLSATTNGKSLDSLVAGDVVTLTVAIPKFTTRNFSFEVNFDGTVFTYNNDTSVDVFTKAGFSMAGIKQVSGNSNLLRFNAANLNGAAEIPANEMKINFTVKSDVEKEAKFSLGNLKVDSGVSISLSTAEISAKAIIIRSVTGVSLDKTTLTLAVNDTGKLTATVTPDNATNKNVTWKSSNTSVATVSADGTVTAMKAGTATITVTTADGGKTATCTVTVVDCKHDGTINHVEAKTATCTATGNIEYWECAKCHTKWSDVGKNTVVTNVTTDKVPHQFTKEVKDAKTLKTAGNCMTEAVYYKSCSVCGEVSKTDTFKGEKDANKHTGKNTYNPNNDGTHSVVCECSTVITAKENCSGGTATCIKKAECTKCGAAYGEFAAHKFDTKWTVGKNTHYHACTVAGCTAKADEAAHGIGTKATCQHGNICDGCQRDDGVKASHTTAASHVYVSDANNHWQLCQWCGVEIGKAGHTWNTPATEDDAAYCTTCGYVKTAAKTPCERHTPGNLVADGTYHYTFCKVCGEQLSKDEHTYGEATTVDGKKVEVCKECGYVKTTTVTPPVTPGKPGKPGNTTGEKKVQSQKTFDAGIALYAGMAVLSLTGSAWMIGKKKEH